MFPRDLVSSFYNILEPIESVAEETLYVSSPLKDALKLTAEPL